MNHGQLGMYIVILKHQNSHKYYIELWHNRVKREIFGFYKGKFLSSGFAYPSSYAKHPREIIACLKQYYKLIPTKKITQIHKDENLWQNTLSLCVSKYQYEIINKIRLDINPLE